MKQVALRIESAVLHGCEALASASPGWPQVARRLNNAHYRCLKSILGIEGASLGTGGYARVMLALGIDLRISTKVALRILSARGRLLSLPSTSSIPHILHGASRVAGTTWMDDSLAILQSFNIQTDFLEFVERLPPTMPPRQKVKTWVRKFVLPALLQFDTAWLHAQPQNFFHWINDADTEKQVLASLARAHWSKREWIYARAWYLTRLSDQPGVFVFGRLPPLDCPYCGRSLTTEHFLQCQSSEGTPWTYWLEPSAEISLLRDKILFVGRHAAQLASVI